MYLHHPLWLLPLCVIGRGQGAKKNSHKHKDYQYSDASDYEYDDDYDYSHHIQHDKNNVQTPYNMYHDSQQLPHRNKLLVIVLGG